jgi:hypothetical protein
MSKSFLASTGKKSPMSKCRAYISPAVGSIMSWMNSVSLPSYPCYDGWMDGCSPELEKREFLSCLEIVS